MYHKRYRSFPKFVKIFFKSTRLIFVTETLKTFMCHPAAPSHEVLAKEPRTISTDFNSPSKYRKGKSYSAAHKILTLNITDRISILLLYFIFMSINAIIQQ